MWQRSDITLPWQKRRLLPVLSQLFSTGSFATTVDAIRNNREPQQPAPARTKLQLVKATAQHLRSVQRRPDRIRSYFEHEPVRYAA